MILVVRRCRVRIAVRASISGRHAERSELGTGQWRSVRSARHPVDHLNALTEAQTAVAGTVRRCRAVGVHLAMLRAGAGVAIGRTAPVAGEVQALATSSGERGRRVSGAAHCARKRNTVAAIGAADRSGEGTCPVGRTAEDAGKADTLAIAADIAGNRADAVDRA